MKRTLRLRSETLAELTPEAMAAVVGGRAPTHDACTLPVTQCAISLGPCQSDRACGTSVIRDIAITGNAC